MEASKRFAWNAVEESVAHLDRRSRFDDLRELMLGWCLWLLGSWAVTLTLDSAAPSVRWMVFAAVTGLMAVWPAVRLSQGQVGVGRPGIGVALSDWLGLMVVLQAVIWPLQLVAQWPWWQTVWLDAAIVSWSLLTAAIIAAGRAFPGTFARSLAMVAALGLLLGEPLVILLARGIVTGPMHLSPIGALYQLTGPLDLLELRALREQVIGIAVAGGLAWVVLATWAVTASWRRRA